MVSIGAHGYSQYQWSHSELPTFYIPAKIKSSPELDVGISPNRTTVAQHLEISRKD